MKACSTTFTSYGTVSNDRQSDILNGMRNQGRVDELRDEPDPATVQQVLTFLQKRAS